MSVLNSADNIKIGSDQVSAVYLDSVLVWPIGGLWSFDTPAPGTTITNFKITTSVGNIVINWGDGTTNTVNSDQTINKTY